MKNILKILLIFVCNSGYSQNFKEIEAHLLNLINEERSSRGLSTFETDTLINNGAKIQAIYLSGVDTRKKITHTNENPLYESPDDRIKISSNLKYIISSENITAFNYDSTRTSLEIAQRIHNNFMGSEYHRMNVLNEIDDVFDEGIIITSYYGHYISYNKKLNLIIAVQMFPTKNFNE
tara:strand:- start:1555 stop:2088 length:534 start_codon:yes stop_codon:yes gene_type:complete